MSNEKSPGKLQKEKEQLKAEEQKVENVFEDKSFVPSEQNRFKDTEPPRSRRN